MRVSWDGYFIEIAKQVSTRATCPRLAVGSVITKDNRILSSGYNGSPKGTPHCSEVGCLIHAGHCIRSLHAELNAILTARESLAGATLYCTHLPCFECSKVIIQSGIARVVYASGDYEDNRIQGEHPLSHLIVDRYE